MRLTDAITDELSWMVGSAEDFTCTHAVALTRKLSCDTIGRKACGLRSIEGS